MADPAPNSSNIVPIPPSLDICHTQADLTLFLQLINLNFEMVANVAAEKFDTPIELPGVSEVTIPGYEFDIAAEKQALDTSWIGGRYPIVSPYARKVAHAKINSWTLPAVPPLELTFSQMNYNIEILAGVIPEFEDIALSMVLPIFNPCTVPTKGEGGDIGGVVPTDLPASPIITRINMLFLQLMEELEEEEEPPPDECPDFDVTDFTDTALWQADLSAAGTRSVTRTTTTMIEYYAENNDGGSELTVNGARAASHFYDPSFVPATDMPYVSRDCPFLTASYDYEMTTTEAGVDGLGNTNGACDVWIRFYALVAGFPDTLTPVGELTDWVRVELGIEAAGYGFKTASGTISVTHKDCTSMMDEADALPSVDGRVYIDFYPQAFMRRGAFFVGDNSYVKVTSPVVTTEAT